MVAVRFVFILIAIVAFLVAAFAPQRWNQGIAIGLAALAASLIAFPVVP